MKTLQLSDATPITGRVITDAGYLKSPAQLSRTGIQEYHARELGMTGDRIVKLYRPAEEVFSADALASFQAVPVTVNHPKDGVSAANWKEHAAGDVLSAAQSGQYMTGQLLIKDAAAIKLVQGGKAELSCGYSFALDETPGEYLGQAYDAVQRNIRGNHVAIVDAGRCGSHCRIADDLPTEEVLKVADRKVIVDGVPVEAADSAATVIEKLIAERNDAREKHAEALLKDSMTCKVGDKTMTISGPELTALLEAKDKEIATLRKDAMTPAQRDAMVADWARLVADVKRLGPDIQTDGKTCEALRKEVVTTLAAKDETVKLSMGAILGGKPIDTADSADIGKLFNLLSATYKPTVTDTRKLGEQLADADKKPVISGRDAHIERMANAWKNEESN